MFCHEPVTMHDFRVAAETLGTWELLKKSDIFAGGQNGAYHAPGRCDVLQEDITDESTVPLEKATKDWCSCLSDHYSHFSGLFPLLPLEKYLQMTIIQHYVTVKTARYQQSPRLGLWLELWLLAGGDGATEVTSVNTSSVLAPWDHHNTDLFLGLSAQLNENALHPTVRMLLESSTREYRKATLRKHLTKWPLPSSLPHDTHEVLLASHSLDLGRFSGSVTGQDLLAVGLVHWSGSHGGPDFYRVPRWTYDLLHGKVGKVRQNHIQCVPWQEGLPLEIIAGLWDPNSGSEMADLNSAIQAAVLV